MIGHKQSANFLFDFVGWGRGRDKAVASAVPTEAVHGGLSSRKACHTCSDAHLPQSREPAPRKFFFPLTTPGPLPHTSSVPHPDPTPAGQGSAFLLPSLGRAGEQGHGGDKNCLGGSCALQQVSHPSTCPGPDSDPRSNCCFFGPAMWAGGRRASSSVIPAPPQCRRQWALGYVSHQAPWPW